MSDAEDQLWAFDEPHPSGGNCQVTMTRAQAIEWHRRCYPTTMFENDNAAFKDWVVLHWAYRVDSVISCWTVAEALDELRHQIYIELNACKTKDDLLIVLVKVREKLDIAIGAQPATREGGEVMNKIWYEMARRKLMFHPDEEWHAINLWLVAYRSEIKRFIDEGLLISSGNYPPRCLGWYRPNEEAWTKYIEPLIQRHSLEELTSLAGW